MTRIVLPSSAASGNSWNSKPCLCTDFTLRADRPCDKTRNHRLRLGGLHNETGVCGRRRLGRGQCPGVGGSFLRARYAVVQPNVGASCRSTACSATQHWAAKLGDTSGQGITTCAVRWLELLPFFPQVGRCCSQIRFRLRLGCLDVRREATPSDTLENLHFTESCYLHQRTSRSLHELWQRCIYDSWERDGHDHVCELHWYYVGCDRTWYRGCTFLRSSRTKMQFDTRITPSNTEQSSEPSWCL